MQSSKNPVAIITGADKGIGEAISKMLFNSGISTVRLSNNFSKLDPENNIQDKNKPFSIAMNLDVRDSMGVEMVISDIYSRFGRIDYLINVAGIAHFGGIELCTEEQWDDTLDTNVKGYFLMTKAVFPLMKKEKKGMIINMSSVWGVRGSPTMLAYSTSKFAVEGFTKCLFEEAKPHGIKVTSIILDKVNTDFRDNMKAHVNFSTEQKQQMLSVEDVADAVKWIINSSSRALPSSITLDAFSWK